MLLQGLRAGFAPSKVWQPGMLTAQLASLRQRAPLQVNMAAVCSHCEAKVNSGEFDWVLSRIEQDEVYGG